MSENISVNRSTLMSLKSKISMAKSGHSLLKKKRDGLIMEFFKMLENSKNLREEMIKKFIKCEQSLNLAKIYNDDLELKFLSKLSKDKSLINFQTKNIMGLTLPQIKTEFKESEIVNKTTSYFTNSSIVDTIKDYDSLIVKIIILAEVETTLLKLLAEIEKTKRRVNGLENTIIPNLEESVKYVKLNLEEFERENTIRLKKIKSKMNKIN